MFAAVLRPLTRIAEGEALARMIEVYNDETPDLLLAPVTIDRASELLGKTRPAFDMARSRGNVPGGLRELPGLGRALYYPSVHAILTTPSVSRDAAFQALRHAYPFAGLTHVELLGVRMQKNPAWFGEAMTPAELGRLLDRSTEALRKAHRRSLPHFETRRDAYPWFAERLAPQEPLAA